MTAIPILEVGGTHVTAAWIDPDGWTVDGSVRRDLDGRGSATELLAELIAAGGQLHAAPGLDWGVAMPGPFDYSGGIGRYTGVGKFESLNGFDVRSALLAGIEGSPRSIGFINDASAFLVGEWLAGAARGTSRSAAITLGTGIGSGFLADGLIIDSGPEVPPDAEAHLLAYHDVPLEDWVSRRALRRRYVEARGDADTGGREIDVPEIGGPEIDVPEIDVPEIDVPEIDVPEIDVREIAELARQGDAIAARVFTEAFTVLGLVLGPWLHRFRAEIVVLGGSISRSWDLIEKPLHEGLSVAGDVSVTLSADPDRAALIGAAYPAVLAARRPA